MCLTFEGEGLVTDDAKVAEVGWRGDYVPVSGTLPTLVFGPFKKDSLLFFQTATWGSWRNARLGRTPCARACQASTVATINVSTANRSATVPWAKGSRLSVGFLCKLKMPPSPTMKRRLLSNCISASCSHSHQWHGLRRVRGGDLQQRDRFPLSLSRTHQVRLRHLFNCLNSCVSHTVVFCSWSFQMEMGEFSI